MAIYDTSGNLKAKYLYDAWGNCTIASETTDYDVANAKTVLNHSERPYLHDISKQRMVIKRGNMTVDAKVKSTSVFYGGRNYNFQYGNWELTVSNTHKTIYHFLYAGSITGMY